MFERYTNLLYRLCYSILLVREDAEDAVQDVFLKYYRKQPTFADEDHEKAWFIRVAVNHCKDILRRRKLREFIPFSEVEELLAEKEAEANDSGVLQALFELADRYRIVMILHYLEGYPVKEVARLCGISQSAVKMRLSRGREQLKERLKGVVIDE
ncbi:MAG: RNA polymerase sigma factor [Lachnospiraceae bacterium]|nr:RNA polymerase sigma factor [Lachnospiraceae bacterium]